MPHPNKRTYTKAFIDTVLTVFRESPIEDYDQKIAEFTRHYSVTRNLLERWIRNSENLAGPKLPEDMGERLDFLIDKTTIRIAEKLDDGDCNLRDLVIAYGILVDKKRLRDGESTDNQKQYIVYERRGIDALSLPTPPGAIESDFRTLPLQRPELREAMGQDSPG